MKLQQLIQQYVPLSNQTNSGFWTIECAACNDHSPRAGFKFENGEVGYKCFNCKRKFRYVEGETIISNYAIQILEAFGIPKSKVMEVVNGNFFETGEITFEKIIESRQRTLGSIIGSETKLPKNTFFIGSDKFPDIQKPIINYLESRKIDPYKIKAMFSLSERHENRVIIPIYQHGKLIHWQSRSILKDVKPRYLTCYDNKNIAIWGLQNSYKHTGPLFITEGIFDASLVDGVAILGSDLSPEKIQILNTINRKKVVVVDYDANGKSLAMAALEAGWEITYAPSGFDINKSVVANGILYTIHTLMRNICQPQQSGVEFMGMDLGAMLELNLKMM